MKVHFSYINVGLGLMGFTGPCPGFHMEDYGKSPVIINRHFSILKNSSLS